MKNISDKERHKAHNEKLDKWSRLLAYTIKKSKARENRILEH